MQELCPSITFYNTGSQTLPQTKSYVVEESNTPLNENVYLSFDFEAGSFIEIELSD